MRLLLAKLCEYAVQQQNGRHSMIGIFDNIVAPFFPIDHPPFHLCIQLEFDPYETEKALDARIVLLDPDGQSILDIGAEGQVPRDANGAPVRLFMHFGIPGLRFERPGDHRLDIVANGTKVGEESLPVLVAPPPG
jgi:hypothetical protein